MRVLFEPGIAVMGRLPNQQKLPLISTLFILPLAILYYEAHAQLPTTVALLVLGKLPACALRHDLVLHSSGRGVAAAHGDSPARRRGRSDRWPRQRAQRPIRSDDECSQGADTQPRARSWRRCARAPPRWRIAANEIAAGNLDLSQRTEEQAARWRRPPPSMEELTGTVKQNADNARQANAARRRPPRDVARQGRRRWCAQVVDTMGEIDQRSQARSPTSSASSTASPSRPTSWR